jgi:hypothetical protein
MQARVESKIGAESPRKTRSCSEERRKQVEEGKLWCDGMGRNLLSGKYGIFMEEICVGYLNISRFEEIYRIAGKQVDHRVYSVM